MSRLRMLVMFGSVAVAGVLCGQDEAPLKARELFYKPLNAAPAAAAAAAPDKATAVKPKKTPVAKKAPDTTVAPPVEKAPMTNSSGAVLTRASYQPQPLGLKYTVLKMNGQEFREVNPDAEFRSGDHIRINVESNDTAYLYIVMQGSSGTWRPLFPNPAILGGNNKIERGKVYQIPPAGSPSFYFDEQPGTEKVSLILTRTPEADLEKLIYAAGQRNKTMMAKNTAISGEVMGQVQQQMLSRDLVFEKVEEGEKAVYAATPDTSDGARVFVDLKLIHR